jgi:hypothetical protein
MVRYGVDKTVDYLVVIFFFVFPVNPFRLGIVAAAHAQQFDDSVHQTQIKKEGGLSQKVERLEGKKSGSRSWKSYWVVLHNGVLLFYKEPPKKVRNKILP